MSGYFPENKLVNLNKIAHKMESLNKSNKTNYYDYFKIKKNKNAGVSINPDQHNSQMNSFRSRDHQ